MLPGPAEMQGNVAPASYACTKASTSCFYKTCSSCLYWPSPCGHVARLALPPVLNLSSCAIWNDEERCTLWRRALFPEAVCHLQQRFIFEPVFLIPMQHTNRWLMDSSSRSNSSQPCQDNPNLQQWAQSRRKRAQLQRNPKTSPG